jgi:hypothetical protein
VSEKESTSFPTPIEFFLDIPLYQSFDVDAQTSPLLWEIEYFEGAIDSYCPECGTHSIFDRKVEKKPYHIKTTLYQSNHLCGVTLICTRDRAHSLFFLFKCWNETLQKIGQHPSIADLNLFDVKKYSAALRKEQFREFTRAIGLAAHGVGIGSFVYLRRIFESLINDAYLLEKEMTGWDDEKYRQSRVSEKIELLKTRLPEFLVKNRSIYAIMSKGIHELTEDECRGAFPIVKVGIEIILDEKLEQLQKDNKQKEAEKAIQALSSVVSRHEP